MKFTLVVKNVDGEGPPGAWTEDYDVPVGDEETVAERGRKIIQRYNDHLRFEGDPRRALVAVRNISGPDNNQHRFFKRRQTPGDPAPAVYQCAKCEVSCRRCEKTGVLTRHRNYSATRFHFCPPRAITRRGLL